MESTGVYWKPIFNILEDDFEIILANAARIKNVPGLKTQTFHKSLIKNCRYGLVPASFIPAIGYPRAEGSVPGRERS
jgi:hypothetical protein